MKTHQKLKLATIILLQLPAVLWSLWSFKMHKDLFSGTKGKQIETHFSGNKFLEHTGSGLLTTGVCPLGKVGAWFILIWSIILIYLLYYYYNKYTSLKDINRVNKIFCTMNSFFHWYYIYFDTYYESTIIHKNITIFLYTNSY